MATDKGAMEAPARLVRQEIGRDYRQWRFNTRAYGGVYYISRVVLIVGSAIVAAQESLADSRAAWLTEWVPVLALLVAVLAALDTWLKPRERWRGFMQSRDDVNDLRVRAADDAQSADELRQELRKIRERHRTINIF